MIFSLLKIHTQHSKKPPPKGGGILFPFFFPTNRLGGIAARHAAASQRGYSLSEENTPFETPRERRGASPLDPRIGSRAIEELRSLRNQVPAKCCCKTIWSTPTARCRSACDSAVLCNFRLLRMLSALQVPARARHCCARHAFGIRKNRPRQRSVLFLRQIFQSIVNALVDKFASAHIEFCGGCVNLCQLIRRNTNRDGLFCILLWDEISHDNHLLQYSML